MVKILFSSLMDMMNILKFCKNSLIADILKRKELPNCGLIVSSHPHASVRLREQATSKVDILGFTETEQEQYIKESLKDQQSKTEKFVIYLQGHSKISIAYALYPSTLLLWFTCTSKESLFLKILLNYTFILYSLLSTITLPIMAFITKSVLMS